MAVFIRAKRVTDPLDDKVRARLRGEDASSGSEHEATESLCFSGLIHAFLENDCLSSAAADGYDKRSDFDSKEADCSVDSAEVVRDVLETSRKDPFLLRLLSNVSEMAEELFGLRSSGSAYRRAVVARLRESGFYAGLCKARWDTSGGLSAGSYEYIDVIIPKEGRERRYIVDLDFSGQFEIARATAEYNEVLEALPRVMVGTAEEVRQLVWIMGDAARRSLRSRALHVPPWRKTRYMLAKWLGPYRRTINLVPSSAGVAVVAGAADVKCRAVGFHTAPLHVVPPATHTEADGLFPTGF